MASWIALASLVLLWIAALSLFAAECVHGLQLLG
jgi:hypothetical protein